MASTYLKHRTYTENRGLMFADDPVVEGVEDDDMDIVRYIDTNAKPGKGKEAAAGTAIVVWIDVAHVIEHHLEAREMFKQAQEDHPSSFSDMVLISLLHRFDTDCCALYFPGMVSMVTALRSKPSVAIRRKWVDKLLRLMLVLHTGGIMLGPVRPQHFVCTPDNDAYLAVFPCMAQFGTINCRGDLASVEGDYQAISDFCFTIGVEVPPSVADVLTEKTSSPSANRSKSVAEQFDEERVAKRKRRQQEWREVGEKVGNVVVGTEKRLLGKLYHGVKGAGQLVPQQYTIPFKQLAEYYPFNAPSHSQSPKKKNKKK